MSDNSGRNDPSMREILGSIRRIINEDNAQGAAANEAAADDEILDLTEEVDAGEAQRPRLDPSFGGAREKEDAAEARREPVLGLHNPDGQAESGTSAQALPESEVSPEPMAEAPVAQDAADAPVTLGATEDEAETDLDETPETAPAEETATEMRIDSAASAMPPETSAVDEPAAEEAVVESEPAKPDAAAIPTREIVSDTTTAATATAIGELTRAMEEQTNKLKLGPGEETISDMVREMLRPMLRDWLDQNLPGIVERIVRREIQKLVDRAETED